MLLLSGFSSEMEAAMNAPCRWAELAAGLLVIGVCSVALDGEDPGRRMIDGARHKVLEAPRFPLTATFMDILRIAEDAALDPLEYCDALRAKLMVYGHSLQAEGMYAAAIDVFTVLSSRSGDDVDFRLQALNERAVSLRRLSRHDDAATTYEMLRIFARQYGVRNMTLVADLGLAEVLIERGDTPSGEAALATVMTRAKRIGDPIILGRGHIAMAAISGVRRDPFGVIEHSHKALEIIKDGYRRDRARVNMAYAFREIRRGDLAAPLVEAVVATSVDLDQRAFALIVLYHIAIDDEDWGGADARRAALAAISLPPNIEAEYHETIGRHMATLGHLERATSALRRMRAIADSHPLAELRIRADEALADVERGIIPKIYERRPIERIPIRSRRVIAAAESALDLLCVG